MATLSSKLIISLVDQVSGPARKIATELRALKDVARSSPFAAMRAETDRMRRSFGTAATSAGGLMASAWGFSALLQPTREFNESIWGIEAAFLGSATAAETNATVLARSRTEAERMRSSAIALSKAYGIMPETFAKAGEEAAKMGLNYSKSNAIMKSSGLVQMSDREAQGNIIAKALGTYGIIYGAPEDDAGYAATANNRASTLALAGAKTRTSASKIEEGSRNYMGLHGAFGGQFEDMIAMIAMGTNTGMMEKEAGTALKSFQSRFLKLDAPARSAIASSGINVGDFADFGEVSPMRAANQLVQMFPQQMSKGARGKMVKFLETAQATIDPKTGKSQLADISIVNRMVQMLEKDAGLKFAGAEDREIAANKIAAVMTNVGGKFDVLGALEAMSKSIEEGRAGPAIAGIVGEQKRIHQTLSFVKAIGEIKKLRDELMADKGRYLELVASGYGGSDAGKIVSLESSLRRFNLSLVRSDGVQAMLKGLADMAEWFEKLPSSTSNAIGGMMAFALVAAPVGFALTGIAAGLMVVYRAARLLSIPLIKVVSLLGGLRGGSAAGLGAGGIAAGIAGVGAAGLAAKSLFSMANRTPGAAAAGAASSRMVAGMGAGGQMVAGMSAAGAAAAAGAAGAAAARPGVAAMIGRLAIKGASRLFLPLALALTAKDAYDGYQKGGLGGAALNAGTLGMYYGAAGAAPATPGTPGVTPGVGAPGAGAAPGGASVDPQVIVVQMRSAMDQVRSIAASAAAEMTTYGQQAAQNFAAGIRAGQPAIAAASSDAFGSAMRGSVRGGFSDGGR
jgi:hypothetical protein